MFSLKLAKLRAELYFEECHLPYWLGNKLRGGFGIMLQRALCSSLSPSCDGCRRQGDCLFYWMYVRDKQRRGKSQPLRPVVFIPPFYGRRLQEQNFTLNVEVNIFGEYIKYLPQIIFALRLLGKAGFNPSSKFTLKSLSNAITGEVVFDGERIDTDAIKLIDLGKMEPLKIGKHLRIKLRTPFSLERADMSLEHLLRMVRGRLILNVNEYGSGEVENFECRSITEESVLKRHELKVKSRRRGLITIPGYTGEISYTVKGIDNMGKKFLNIGLLCGAGAKSSYGMGFYTLEAR